MSSMSAFGARSDCTGDSEMLKEYKYQPLDLTEALIRVIKLETTDDGSDQIRCRLVHVDLHRTTYVALSYTWGIESDVGSILIEGAVLYLRENLIRFLRSFWASHTRRRSQIYLWIDAVCINQKDAEERNHQVRQMGLIYKSAQQVLVWLESDLSEEDDDRTRQFWTIAQADRVTRRQYDSRCMADRPCGACLLGSFRYWSRLWVIQELMLATKIIVLLPYGFLLRWDEMWNFMLTCIRCTGTLAYRHYVSRDRMVGYQNSLHQDLGSLLVQHDQAQCLDNKDRIFGLLSLADPASKFAIDYRDSSMKLVCRATLLFHSYSTWFDDLVRALKVSDEDVIATIRQMPMTRITNYSLAARCQKCNLDFYALQGHVGLIRLFQLQNCSVVCLSIQDEELLGPKHLIVQTLSPTGYPGPRCYGPIDELCHVEEVRPPSPSFRDKSWSSLRCNPEYDSVLTGISIERLIRLETPYILERQQPLNQDYQHSELSRGSNYIEHFNLGKSEPLGASQSLLGSIFKSASLQQSALMQQLSYMQHLSYVDQSYDEQKPPYVTDTHRSLRKSSLTSLTQYEHPNIVRDANPFEDLDTISLLSSVSQPVKRCHSLRDSPNVRNDVIAKPLLAYWAMYESLPDSELKYRLHIHNIGFISHQTAEGLRRIYEKRCRKLAYDYPNFNPETLLTRAKGKMVIRQTI